MTDTTSTSDAVRDQVARAYTAALETAQHGDGGCCGAAGGCCGAATATMPAGVAARTAGYDEEIARHGDAAASSFGCGNPLAFAGVEPGHTVVDLGSGAGFDLLIAAEAVGPTGRVIGVDMTDAMIEAARANATSAGFDQIEVRRGLIEELPLADGVADWVISNCVINLSPEKDRVFAEIRRVLRPGGRFSIADIVVGDLPDVVRTHPAAYAACVAGAVSEQAYLDGLRAAGLHDVVVRERQVYEPSQLRGMIAGDLETAGLDAGALDGVLDQLTGQVASIRVEGRRPPS